MNSTFPKWPKQPPTGTAKVKVLSDKNITLLQLALLVLGAVVFTAGCGYAYWYLARHMEDIEFVSLYVCVVLVYGVIKGIFEVRKSRLWNSIHRATFSR